MMIVLQAQASGGTEAAVSGVGLNLLLGIVAAFVIGSKGHSGGQVLFHLMFGVFCCGIGSLISAIVAKDLNVERKLEALETTTRRIKNREWREYQEVHEAADVDSSAATPGISQVRCPRCGSMNALELDNCWHCGLAFRQSSSVPVVDANDPRQAKWKALREQRERERMQELEDVVGRNLDAIRVQCNACRKRFSGAKGKLQSMKACPECGATPFDYRVLPAK
ncbi:MAG: hypothetical protein R3E76_04070 [Planctomycetota bacterium]